MRFFEVLNMSKSMLKKKKRRKLHLRKLLLFLINSTDIGAESLRVIQWMRYDIEYQNNCNAHMTNYRLHLGRLADVLHFAPLSQIQLTLSKFMNKN